MYKTVHHVRIEGLNPSVIAVLTAVVAVCFIGLTAVTAGQTPKGPQKFIAFTRVPLGIWCFLEAHEVSRLGYYQHTAYYDTLRTTTCLALLSWPKSGLLIYLLFQGGRHGLKNGTLSKSIVYEVLHRRCRICGSLPSTWAKDAGTTSRYIHSSGAGCPRP
ncbi:hypothetical protein F4861DRAFT_401096 [Xylaria intraflava]|nr:hypothetical protein F4861DRAFT_401096 [Xylaria intraflava]